MCSAVAFCPFTRWNEPYVGEHEEMDTGVCWCEYEFCSDCSSRSDDYLQCVYYVLQLISIYCSGMVWNIPLLNLMSI